MWKWKWNEEAINEGMDHYCTNDTFKEWYEGRKKKE
jgi:hypothetical protein